MTPNLDSHAPWNAGIAFWCGLWQAQMETGLRFWAIWAQSLPHPDARTLAAEAQAEARIHSQKPKALRVPARRASARKTGTAAG